MKLQWVIAWLVFVVPCVAIADEAGKAWLDRLEFKDEFESDTNASEPLEQERTWPLVGLRGDPHQIKFEGLEQLTERQLQWALSGDLVYQAAARTTAPLDKLVNTLENRLREGFLHSGFLQASVAASYHAETDSLHVVVSEGQRFTNGEIIVQGANHLDADKLESELLAPGKPRRWIYYSGGKPFEEGDSAETYWKKGSVTQCDEETMKCFSTRIRYHLIEQGFPLARFSVNAVPNSNHTADHTASLVITIEDEGARGTLSDVHVTGLERHTKEQLLAYLELEPGMALDNDVLNDTWRRLRESCRFWNYKVLVRNPMPDADRYVRQSADLEIGIAVQEYPHTPLLKEPLTDAELTMKKAALWFENLGRGADVSDLVVQVDTSGMATEELPGAVYKLILSPAHGGGLLQLEIEDNSKWSIDHTFVLSPEVIQIIGWRQSRQFSVSESKKSPRFSAAWGIADVQEGKFRNSLKLGWGLGRRDIEYPTGISCWTFTCEPIAFVNMLHREDHSHELKDGELWLRSVGSTVQIDRESGEILGITASGSEEIGNGRASINFQKDALQQSLAEIRERENQLEEFYDQACPLESFADFVFAELLDQPVVGRSDKLRWAMTSVQPYLDSTWLREVVAMIYLWDASQHDAAFRFIIPPVEEHSCDDMFDFVWQALVRATPAAADTLFPRGSWPWVFAREMAFELCEVKSYDLLEGRRAELNWCINSEDTIGLLGDYLAIQTVGRSPDSVVAKLVSRAKSKVNEESFAQDIQLLIRGDHGFARMVQFAVTTLDGLTVAERNLVREYVNPMWRKPFEALLERRQSHPDESPADAVEAVAREWWNDGLEDYFHNELEKLLPQEVALR